MAFRFNECSMRALAAFAEGLPSRSHARGLPTDLDAGPEIGRPVALDDVCDQARINLGYRRFLANLRRYTDKRFATTPG